MRLGDLGEPVRAADRRPRACPTRPRRTARRCRCSSRSGRRKRWTSQNPTTARLVRISFWVITSFGSREAMPKVTIRPKGAITERQASKAAPPDISRTTSTCSPPLASRIASARSSERESTLASAPSRSVSSRFSGVEARAMTRAPMRLASCTARVPVPPAAAWTTTRLAGLDPPADAQQRPRGQTLEQDAGGLVVGDLLGDRHQRGLRHHDPLGVAAVHQHRGDAASVGRASADLTAGDQRQLRLREVVVLALMGVREVHPGTSDVDERPRPRRARDRAGRRPEGPLARRIR